MVKAAHTPVTPAEAGGLVEKWRRHAEDAQRTLNIKASEAAKGHDWVVDTEVFRSQDVIDVATALEAKEAELEAVKAYSIEMLHRKDEQFERAERAEASLIAERAALAEAMRLLSRYRIETPLGNQPHMIAHEVDDFTSRALLNRRAEG